MPPRSALAPPTPSSATEKITPPPSEERLAPSRMVMPIKDALLEHGKMVRGWLGVELVDHGARRPRAHVQRHLVLGMPAGEERRIISAQELRGLEYLAPVKAAFTDAVRASATEPGQPNAAAPAPAAPVRGSRSR